MEYDVVLVYISNGWSFSQMRGKWMKNPLPKLSKTWKKLEYGYPLPHPTFVESLIHIQKMVQKKKMIRFGEIFHALSGRGYPALLIVLSLPFCFPISIPGVSTPFGFALAFIGLRMMFGRRPWWPQWILQKELSVVSVNRVVAKTLSIFLKLQKILSPRFSFLFWDTFRYVHGGTIFLLSLVLSLPLPIPLSNFFAAIPILLFGIGLLEDDGLVILLAYLAFLACVIFFLVILFFGHRFVSNFI